MLRTTNSAGYLCAFLASIVFVIGAATLETVAQPPAAMGSASAQSQADDVVLDLSVRDRRNRPVLDLRPGAGVNIYVVVGDESKNSGELTVDRETHGVMSITNITDEVPKRFPIRKVAVRVDYDYVAINNHDYLLPVNAQVISKLAGNSFSGEVLRRNDIAFSNFRKYGSNARILVAGQRETRACPQGCQP
jgi:hypothetical protein